VPNDEPPVGDPAARVEARKIAARQAD